MSSETAQPQQGLTADVVVVGAGPVGLSLALHLDAHGVKTLLVESETAARWYPKGNTNNARTMELLRKLSLAEQVRALGLPDAHPFDIAFFTRLSAFEIARGFTQSRGERMARRAAGPATDQIVEPPHRANQMYVEKFLLDEVKTRSNIVLRLGTQAEEMQQDADGVSVRIKRLNNGEVETWRARYIVGCDGSRGLVRKSLGIKYAGEEQLMDVFMAGIFTSVHMRIPDLYRKFVGHRKAWMYVVINPDMRAQIMALNGVDEFMIHIPTKPGDVIDLALVANRVKKAIGADIPVEIISHRQWSAGTYLVAERYRRGRAFLAGDAAHLYAPTGGFGMNTGIDDSANLAWKLAGAIHGWGGEALLDSYEVERRAIALRNSGAAREFGKARHDVKTTPVVEEDTPAGEQARRDVAQSDFILKSHFILPEERDSQGIILGGRYDNSPITITDGEAPEDSHELYRPSDLPGGRAPHMWLNGSREQGSSLYDKFGLGFALLRFGETPRDTARLEEAARSQDIPLRVVDVPQAYARELYRRDLYLIRPDNYIAWCGNELPNDVDGMLARVTGRN